MPLCIYVKIRNATWQLPGLGVGIYPLKPRKRVWYRDRGQTVGISRTGFTLVADLTVSKDALSRLLSQIVWKWILNPPLQKCLRPTPRSLGCEVLRLERLSSLTLRNFSNKDHLQDRAS